MKLRLPVILTDLSLTTKTLFFIVVVTILPSAVVMWLLLNSLAAGSIAAEDRAFAQTAELVQRELVGNVRARAEIYDITFKSIIQGTETLKDEILTAGASEAVLARFYYRHPLISRAYFIRPDGTNLVVPSPDTTILAITDTVGFDFDDPAGGRVTTGRWIGPHSLGKDGARAMTYALPIWRRTELVGVIAFDVLASNILSEVVDLDPAESSYVLIVRRDGEFFTTSDAVYGDLGFSDTTTNLMSVELADHLGIDELIAAREELLGTLKIPAREGSAEKFAVYATIPSFGAHLFVVSPLEELLVAQRAKAAEISGALNATARSGAVLLVLLAILIAVTAYASSERTIIRPLQRIMQGIEDLERAGYDPKTALPVNSRDEIGRLSARFNDMATRLHESYESLERKVRERTEELNKNLNEMERLNKLMVGRELRMRELKHEIARLKEQKTPPA
jgi:HAMP domain-containing protein